MKRTIFPVVFCGVIITYFIISKSVFDKVDITSSSVIDEEFHIPQAKAYCNFTFNTWDPKITTLPGLYLLSAFILGPFHLCSTYALRFINLLASVLNLGLFYICFRKFNKQGYWIHLFSSVNLCILPPLYFFSHLYYTDIVSLTFILLLLILNKTENHILASLCGAMAVLIRQTNIIWVIMIMGQYCMQQLFFHSHKHHKYVDIEDASLCVVLTTVCGANILKVLKKFTLNIWLNIFCYFSVLSSFALFVILNGSIVVGDKTAHTASIHLPQLLYYALFCMIFTWPYYIKHIVDFIRFIPKQLLLNSFTIVVCFCMVFFNTLEHPYLLADNRHYIFYIWNRLYGKYFWFRFVMIPVYLFALFALLQKLKTKHNSSFLIIYFVCTIVVLVPQKLIELRYFIVPYIIFRIHIKDITVYNLICEFIFYLILNVFTFNVFFTKEIYWSDFKEIQRLMW